MRRASLWSGRQLLQPGQNVSEIAGLEAGDQYFIRDIFAFELVLNNRIFRNCLFQARVWRKPDAPVVIFEEPRQGLIGLRIFGIELYCPPVGTFGFAGIEPQPELPSDEVVQIHESQVVPVFSGIPFGASKTTRPLATATLSPSVIGRVSCQGAHPTRIDFQESIPSAFRT